MRAIKFYNLSFWLIEVPFPRSSTEGFEFKGAERKANIAIKRAHIHSRSLSDSFILVCLHTYAIIQESTLLMTFSPDSLMV